RRLQGQCPEDQRAGRGGRPHKRREDSPGLRGRDMIFPASSNMAGMCFAFPDVCKTPSPAGPVPSPYPNIPPMPVIKGGTASSKVKIINMKAATVDTETSLSNGDEPGVAGGVVCGKNMQGGKYKMGSTRVYIEGKMAAHLTSMTGQNDTSNSNIPPGLQVAPSQMMVAVTP